MYQILFLNTVSLPVLVAAIPYSLETFLPGTLLGLGMNLSY